MADTKISALTDAATIVGTEEVPVVQSATTKRATIAELTPGLAASSATASGIVELATSAETITGTDTTRAVTAAGITALVADSTFLEKISDQVGTMVTGNTETGIAVTYQDADNTLDFVVDFSGVQPLDADLTDIAAISDAQGDIIVRGAAGWERLAKSATATDVLTAGASQPAWAAAAAGGVKPAYGTNMIGVPGGVIGGGTVTGISYTLNTDYYLPMTADAAITITDFGFYSSTGPASDATVYIAIYDATALWQPTGTPLYTGSIAVTTASTGFKSNTGLSVALPAGRYVAAMNTNVTFSIGILKRPSPMVHTTPQPIASLAVGRTAATFTSSPTAWTTTAVSDAFFNHLWFKWT